MVDFPSLFFFLWGILPLAFLSYRQLEVEGEEIERERREGGYEWWAEMTP